MLGKLIKYDLRSTSRYLLPLHAVVLAAGVIGGIVIQTVESISTIATLYFIAYMLITIGVGFATYVILGVRFYKNLFTDEGYLSFTLPVSRSTHLLAKTISGSIWAILSGLLILLSFLLCINIFEIVPMLGENITWGQLNSLFSTTFGFSLVQMLIMIIFFFIIDAAASVILIYLSIAIGQMLFSGHKVLGSVIAYIALNTILSLVAALLMFSSSLMPGFTETISVADPDFTGFLRYFMFFNLAVMLGQTAITYIGTWLIMKKRVNLA